jgi:arylsulfatase
VVFERAIAASSRTSPAHASIMTSRYTREHSIGYQNGSTRLEGARSLAHVFREAGYDTAAFVSNPNLRRRTGFENGFSVYDDDMPERERNRLQFERTARNTSKRAVAWLDDRAREPFFLWVHYQDPHGPYAAPPEYAGRTRVEAPEGEKPLPVLKRNDGAGGIPAYQVLEGVTRLSDYKARYADEIAYADEWIGRLLDRFDARRGERPGLVLLTADHGESFGAHGRYLVHGFSTTPPLAHVPLILRAPELEPGRRRRVVNHVDVMPTLLELAGLPAPDGMSGVALGPWLRNEAPPPDRVVYCDIGSELSAYRDDAFLRIDGLRGAWPGDDGDSDGESQWLVYTWSKDGHFTPLPRGKGLEHPLHERFAQVNAYSRSAIPMLHSPLDPATEQRLRALGYLDDGADTP